MQSWRILGVGYVRTDLRNPTLRETFLESFLPFSKNFLPLERLFPNFFVEIKNFSLKLVNFPTLRETTLKKTKQNQSVIYLAIGLLRKKCSFCGESLNFCTEVLLMRIYIDWNLKQCHILSQPCESSNPQTKNDKIENPRPLIPFESIWKTI